MFNLKAANHQIILTSGRYRSKAAARNGIASVRKNAPDNGNYGRLTSKAGPPYFALKAANHQVIGTSEMYSGTGAMENGIVSVKRNAPGAELADVTALSQ